MSKETAKKTVVPAPRQGADDSIPDPNLFRVQDTTTRLMVKDLARERPFPFNEINTALYAYGTWLEFKPDAWEHLGTPGPTDRVFSTAR